MRKRGTAITSLKFEEITALDQQLTDMIQDDEKYEALAQPVCAFITFESDDGKNEALAFAKETMFDNQRKVHPHLTERMIMNKPPVFTQATEPSNIIWENRYIVGANYYARVTAITLISVFMLALAFFVIFSFKKSQITLASKWPSIKLKDFEAPHIAHDELYHLAGLE